MQALPPEVVDHILLFVQSPTATIIRDVVATNDTDMPFHRCVFFCVHYHRFSKSSSADY